MFSIIFDLGSFRIVDFYRLLANPFALLYQWSPPGGVNTALSLRCFSVVRRFPIDHYGSGVASFETSQRWLLRVLSLWLVLRLAPVFGVFTSPTAGGWTQEINGAIIPWDKASLVIDVRRWGFSDQ